VWSKLRGASVRTQKLSCKVYLKECIGNLHGTTIRIESHSSDNIAGNIGLEKEFGIFGSTGVGLVIAKIVFMVLR